VKKAKPLYTTWELGHKIPRDTRWEKAPQTIPGDEAYASPSPALQPPVSPSLSEFSLEVSHSQTLVSELKSRQTLRHFSRMWPQDVTVASPRCAVLPGSCSPALAPPALLCQMMRQARKTSSLCCGLEFFLFFIANVFFSAQKATCLAWMGSQGLVKSVSSEIQRERSLVSEH